MKIYLYLPDALALQRIALMIWLCGAPFLLTAQPPEIDSLKSLLAEAPPVEQKMEVLNNLGLAYQRYDPKQGLVYHEEALQLALQEGDTTQWLVALTGKGNCYKGLGDVDAAEETWQQVLDVSELRKDTIRMAKMYVNLGILQEIRGNLNAAIAAYAKGLPLLEQRGETFSAAATYNNMGLVAEKQGDYAQAVEYFLQSLERFEEIESDRGASAILGNLGMVFYKQKEFDEALEYYKRSLAIDLKMKDIVGIANVYNNIGGLYETTDQLDSAIYYHKKSLEIKQEIGNPLAICATYNNLGIAYYRAKNYAQARDYQLKAYEIAQQEESNSDLARTSADLGRAYLKLGQTNLAERYLRESLTLSEQVGERENSLKVYKSLYELYKSQEDFRAFDFYEKYVNLNDSLRNDEQTREITRLEMQYEFDKEKEILALERQQNEALLQSQIQRQRLIRNASLGGLGAGMSILFVLWQSYRQKQESNRQLEEQRDTVQRALEDRETLLKEIHHRVKNNLQIISSLLSLQSRQIADPKALEAIQEGRNRVNSMALIHKNLYQDENLVGVDTIEYIDKLTESLVSSYNINLDHITIEKDIDRMKLDVDTIIPLGLILNELISNSLKYAFPNEQQGKIKTILKKKDDGLHLQVADNGKGLPPDFDIENLKSLGFRLVKAFAQKLNAELKIHSGEGTRIELFVPKEKLV